MKKYVIIGILFSISIAFNIYFLCGKGITINNYTTNHQEQYQQQWSGQLLLNQWNTQGDQIEWKSVKCLLENVPKELTKLHPISSFYCKITLHSNSAWVDLIYPDIFTKTKEVQK
jgi:hypothetical protein